jgi:hypothetical protein
LDLNWNMSASSATSLLDDNRYVIAQKQKVIKVGHSSFCFRPPKSEEKTRRSWRRNHRYHGVSLNGLLEGNNSEMTHAHRALEQRLYVRVKGTIRVTDSGGPYVCPVRYELHLL